MTLIGVGWYKKDQWDHLRRISTDREKLEATWDEWAQVAEQRFVELMQMGATPQKVPVDITELELWCKANRRPCDGAARAAYITLHLK